MTQTLHIATYNIHKGFSHFNRRLMVHELRDQLRQLHVDLIFLQEVQGEHNTHSKRFEHWPAAPQYEYLADTIWHNYAYGKNAVYDEGHHGNAILSRYPIVSWENEDISTNRFENRGLLHCEVAIPEWEQPLHCLCVHLGLLAKDRRKQLTAVVNRINRLVPATAPLIVAGDFNDWRLHAGTVLAESLQLQEVFEAIHGKPARSFPANFPLLSLDRIYVRGFQIEHAHTYHGLPWSRISDHTPLSARMTKI